jgi:hypothetical protein
MWNKFFTSFFVLVFAFVFASCGDIAVNLGPGDGGGGGTTEPPGEEEGEEGEEEGEEGEEEGYKLGDFEIGDVGPAGGLIFYIDEEGEFEDFIYLEAAVEDLEGTHAYSNITDGIGPSAQGLAIGTGYSNSLAIIDQEDHTDSAAMECIELVQGGESDFFLPSKDELNKMYVNLHQQGLGGFAFDSYWSSSEFVASTYCAWGQYFGSGAQFDYYKDGFFYVRCVRAF